MTFLAGWALAGLVLLAPLVLVHLRQRSGEPRDVPSLLLWHELELDAPGRGRRLAPPPLALVLVLQAIALTLLVLALAEPGLSAALRPTTVVVLDDSFWMTAPGALADAKAQADGVLASLRTGTPVRVVLADGSAEVLYRGSASGARRAIAAVPAGSAPADLSGALTVAAGLLTGRRDRVVLIRAADDRAPALRVSPGELLTLVAGRPTPDVGIYNPVAQCGIASAGTCEVTASVSSTAAGPEVVHLVAAVPGQPDVGLSAQVGAHATSKIRLLASPGARVTLSLAHGDGISADDRAYVTVPGDDDIPRAAAVTVVGTPAQARPLAQAFAAVPGVALRLETPSGYRAGAARASDLVVLDGALPGGKLPPAPAVMLVDPPTLPGGHVEGTQADAILSGLDSASPLLADADLSSLTIQHGTARRLVLPRWLAPVIWSPSGPLLAAGDDGRTRVVVTAFQPGDSTLTQLAGFPVLAANLLRWSLAWAPGTARAGAPVSFDALAGARTATLARNGTEVAHIRLGRGAAALDTGAPGVYTLDERGPGVNHRTTIDVNLGAPPGVGSPAVDLRTAGLRAGPAPRTPLAPWLLAVALVVLALEWVLWSLRGPRVVS